MMPGRIMWILIGFRLSAWIVRLIGFRIGQRVAKIKTNNESSDGARFSINRVEAQVIKKEIKMAYSDDDIDMEAYLKACGYKSVEEWALDSDFEYDDDQDVWFNEDGNPVDIEEQLYYVIDSLTEE
jgi:hypothetical protein